MTYENAVLYSLLLAAYKKGEYDIEQTKKILIDLFGEERCEELLKKIVEIFENLLKNA